ncbi:hypothetical protein QO058_21880 [Bosea vestrisii]|nr:hypothetical protein [Bosea vestrisii]WID95398.1 hypothetical protein QO058_21880 [Bosea vestrisii]
MTTAAMAPPVIARGDATSGQARDRVFWGVLMLAPYLLVFAVMVVYPVAYGLWLGLNWQSYKALFADPIFVRTVVNTVVFLFIAVNLKFLMALFLSGFFVQQRAWVRFILVLFILPWAVPSIPTILSFRVMLNPENGMINQQLFHWFRNRRGTGLADRSDTRFRLFDPRPYLEVAAVLDADPRYRPPRHRAGPL